MKQITVLSFISFFLIIIPASADITPDDISGALPKSLSHPYLYFTEQEKPAIRDRIANDPESKDIMTGFEIVGTG